MTSGPAEHQRQAAKAGDKRKRVEDRGDSKAEPKSAKDEDDEKNEDEVKDEDVDQKGEPTHNRWEGYIGHDLTGQQLRMTKTLPQKHPRRHRRLVRWTGC